MSQWNRKEAFDERSSGMLTGARLGRKSGGSQRNFVPL